MKPPRPQPIKRYGLPAYPTRLAVLAEPELLRRHIPRSWLSNRELASTAGAFLIFGASGAHGQVASATSQPASSTQPMTGAVPAAHIAPHAPAILAPVFKHGSGRGHVGCVVVNPPTFLSEEEAFQVIAEELKTSGIDLSQRDVPFEQVQVPLTPWQWVRDSAGNRTYKSRTDKRGPLHVDGVDPALWIAAEFVSREDFDDIRGPWYERTQESTAYDVNLVEVADFVRDKCDGKREGVYLGVFYDPATQPRSALEIERSDEGRKHPERNYWDEVSKEAALESKRLLRQQVKDFIDWLKAQGAI